MNTSSFSYEKFFHGHSVMFIVPHEDDEINMAGATIYGAIQEGLEVYVVFLTMVIMNILLMCDVMRHIKWLKKLDYLKRILFS